MKEDYSDSFDEIEKDVDEYEGDILRLSLMLMQEKKKAELQSYKVATNVSDVIILNLMLMQERKKVGLLFANVAEQFSLLGERLDHVESR
jgi:hypothetical protein